MAEAFGSAAAQSDAFPRFDAPAAMGIAEQHNPVEADDDSEWEYEYSTTETETYYLTVDLSLPEFKTATKKNPLHARAGVHKTLLQTPREREAAERSAQSRTQALTRATSTNENEEEPEPAPAAGDEDMADIDPSLRGPPEPTVEPEASTSKRKRKAVRHDDGEDKEGDSEEEEENEVSTEDIQILDLHSDRPIFSYRGRIFEGQWAENVGTEMILTEHDEDNADTLPVLRHLAGDVDLLAASASRIITKEKQLKPKVQHEDTLGPIQKEWNINIPKGAYKMSERAKQGEFLEKLMALKIKKGQKDLVTVYARRPEDEDGNEKPKRRRRAKGKVGGGPGSGPPRGSRTRRGRNRSLAATAHSDRPAEEGSLSTPTPQAWAELDASGPRRRQAVSYEGLGGVGRASDNDFEPAESDGNDDEMDEDDED